MEKLIRLRLAERFPDHDIIGEEMQEHLGRDSGFIWAVDPIDGTINFVNDLPLFSASIGILHRCLPVAGADAPSEICTKENNKWSTTAFDAARPKADLRVQGAAIGGIRTFRIRRKRALS